MPTVLAWQGASLGVDGLSAADVDLKNRLMNRIGCARAWVAQRPFAQTFAIMNALAWM